MDGAELADLVAVTDHGARPFAAILEILRRDADGRVRVEDVSRANRGRALDEQIRHEPGARADLDLGADHAVRSDFGTVADTCILMDDRGRVNRHYESAAGRSVTLHISTASATKRSST